jgi:hypothetical protein
MGKKSDKIAAFVALAKASSATAVLHIPFYYRATMPFSCMFLGMPLILLIKPTLKMLGTGSDFGPCASSLVQVRHSIHQDWFPFDSCLPGHLLSHLHFSFGHGAQHQYV